MVLAQGSVEITTANKDKVMMKPSEKVDIKDGSFVSKQKVDALDYTSWMNGIICLQGENIQDIAKMLSRHYGVKLSATIQLQLLSMASLYFKIPSSMS